MHLRNFFEAVLAGKPEQCNNTPDLGAAAVVTIAMGKNSYRQDKVFYFDPASRRVSEGRRFLVAQWEAMSKAHAAPHHVPGWRPARTAARFPAPRVHEALWPLDRRPPPEAKL